MDMSVLALGELSCQTLPVLRGDIALVDAPPYLPGFGVYGLWLSSGAIGPHDKKKPTVQGGGLRSL